MKSRTTPPLGCTHTPPCPHRRACKKYDRLTDRGAAGLLMGFDDLLAGFRRMHIALHKLASVDVSALTVEQNTRRNVELAIFQEYLNTLAAVAERGAEVLDGTPVSVSLPTLH